MTTIVAAHGTVAADRRATAHTTINLLPSGTKIRRLADGSIVAGAGTLTNVLECLAWFERGQTAPKPKFKGAHILHITKDGATEYCDSLTPLPVMLPYAIGSGSAFALGALAAGASVEGAMGIAHQFDSATGAEIDVLRLSE